MRDRCRGSCRRVERRVCVGGRGWTGDGGGTDRFRRRIWVSGGKRRRVDEQNVHLHVQGGGGDGGGTEGRGRVRGRGRKRERERERASERERERAMGRSKTSKTAATSYIPRTTSYHQLHCTLQQIVFQNIGQNHVLRTHNEDANNFFSPSTTGSVFASPP